MQYSKCVPTPLMEIGLSPLWDAVAVFPPDPPAEILPSPPN